MRLQARWIGAVVLLGALMLAESFAQAPANPSDNEQAAENAGQSSAGQDALTAAWEWTVSNPIVASTVLLTAFTFALAVSSLGLWNETRKARERQIRDMEIIQRAYIAVDPAAVRAIKEPENYAMAVINIRNVGNLPARNLKWAIKSKFSRDMRLKGFPVSRGEAEGDNTLPPGSAMLQGSNPFEAAEMKAAIRGLYVYIWGAVFYEDGFGRERTTRFCHRYHCVNFRGTRIRPDVARFHRYGNEAD